MAPRKPKPTKSLLEVVAEGDHRRSLEALRDLLASAAIVADPNVIPQIAGRLQAVLSELASLSPGEEKDAASEFARKRAARIADANAVASAPECRVQRRR